MKKILLSTVIVAFVFALVGYCNAKDRPKEWSKYVVRSGDTLCDIAIDITPNSKDYRETEYYIKKKNNMEKSNIYSGQTILVPVYE